MHTSSQAIRLQNSADAVWVLVHGQTDEQFRVIGYN